MIAFNRVSMTYHGRKLTRRVFSDVSCVIRPGDALGLCGANGAGKSTFLRLLAGVEQPTAGRVDRRMSVSWPIGHSNCFQTSLTGADNARFIARIYRMPVEPLLAFVEDFAQLGEYLRQPVKTYSSGMQARLAFAISLAIDFDCYLVDEVMSVGDRRFSERCHAALAARRASGTLVMVSHQPEALLHYCTRGAVIGGGGVAFFDTIEEALDVHNRQQCQAA